MKYHLVIRYKVGKLLSAISNLSIFLIYIPLSILIILLIFGYFKINLDNLLQNNFFIGFFSSLVGGALGLTGIIVQLNKQRVSDSLRYQYDNIFVPLYKITLLLKNDLIEWKFNDIYPRFIDSISEIDFEFRVSKLVKHYIEIFRINTYKTTELFDKMGFIIHETKYKPMKKYENVGISDDSPRNPVKQLMTDNDILFKYIDIKSQVDHSIEMSGLLKNELKKNKVYQELNSEYNLLMNIIENIEQYYRLNIKNVSSRFY